MSTTTVSRTATTGLIGGALWALFPVASNITSVTTSNSAPSPSWP